ncbi:hypothetical protein PLICRDRAFT_174513 [Plicaturopsis crispa FD-325 SS-3]|nr:hypothetical protein PLICRDRAFT_174513 [Plicaturopsis crispa FD-325 SS-3]
MTAIHVSAPGFSTSAMSYNDTTAVRDASQSDHHLHIILSRVVNADQPTEFSLADRNTVPCRNCTKAFDVCRQREAAECIYHPGKLVPEAFDFAVAGTMRVTITRVLMMWTCCDEDPESPGCVERVHVSGVTGHM